MKRYIFTLATVIAGLMLVVPASALAMSAVKADAPTQSAPKAIPPVCTFLFGKNGKVVQPAVVAKGIANRGICRDRNGNKVWGTQFSYAKLTVTGYGDTTGCPVKRDYGTTGEAGVIPITLKGVTVTYTINVWLPKTATHLASLRSDPRATRSFTVTIPGGKPTVCPGDPPVVTPEGPNSPTGSGKGGDAQTGFNCAWAGQQLIVDQYGIHVPGFDCSGNGSCFWKSEGNSFDYYGYTFYASRVECSNGVLGIPIFKVSVSYPDGSPSCKLIPLSDTSTFPLPTTSFYGDLSVEVILVTGARRSTRDGLPQVLVAGPIHGTGTTRLC